jgi:hypothetical protein
MNFNTIPEYSCKGTEPTRVIPLVKNAGQAPSLSVYDIPPFEISRETLDKVSYTVSSNRTIIGWYLLAQESSAFKVLDILFFPQKVTTLDFRARIYDPKVLEESAKQIKPECRLFTFVSCSHGDYDTTLSKVDLKQILWTLEEKSWTFIVNRKGDFRLIFVDRALSEKHYVEYVPWSINESITWNWDTQSLDVIMNQVVEDRQVLLCRSSSMINAL